MTEVPEGPSAPGGTCTLQEAADALGVHYMTAYRYVRLGVLPATKAGAVWQVALDDLSAFVEARPTGVAKALDDDAAVRPARRRAPWAERLEARLLAGDGRGAWSVMEAALAAGMDVSDVYLRLITPAMTSIGERWERGEVDVAAEHRASGIVLRLLGRLAPRMARRGRSRGTVVLGAPVGELHSLPVAMVADLVRSGGFEVSDLGADVPPASFLHIAHAAPRLVAVGVSVTNPESLDAASDTITVLRDGLDETVAVMAGGFAVRDQAHAESLGADTYAPDGCQVVDLLDRLTGRNGNEP